MEFSEDHLPQELQLIADDLLSQFKSDKNQEAFAASTNKDSFHDQGAIYENKNWPDILQDMGCDLPEGFLELADTDQEQIVNVVMDSLLD